MFQIKIHVFEDNINYCECFEYENFVLIAATITKFLSHL